MKKLVNTIYVLLFFVSFMLPIFSMDLIPDKYTLVSFKADDGIVPIEKKNIPLIPLAVVCAAQQGYGAYQKKPKIITLPRGISKDQMILINNALNARPDTFKTDHFEKLDKNKQSILINFSGWYESEPKTMIISPEVIKRLLWICLPPEIAHKIEILAGINKEKDDLIRHSRRQLIENKSSVGLVKQPRKFGNLEHLAYEIDLPTLFVNGYFDCNIVKRPIYIPIDDKRYKTYAYNFVSPHLECRITECKKNKNSSDYLLWVIDHKNPQATFTEPIHHSSPIIGCCFSKTKTNVEYVITYSENDIIFSTISMFKDGFSDIKTVRVDTTSKGKNVAAAYCNTNNQLTMGMYQGIDNIFIQWYMDGTSFSHPSRWPFKQYGLLEKIKIKKNEIDEEEAFIIYVSCGQYDVYKWKNLGNNPWAPAGTTGMTALYNIPQSIYGSCFQKNNEIFMYKYSPSPFSSIEKAEKQQQQLSFFQQYTQGFIDDFNFMPDDESHKKYSSSGELILSNSLKKEYGLLYVKTELLDPVTHTSMLSIDTIYKNFFGVGFDNEEKKLIFVHNNSHNAEVCLWDEQDKKDIEWFAGHALGNLGTISLLVRLLGEIKKKNEIVLKESDPICIMLRDWAKKSPHALAFMKKCFPMRVVKG